MQANLAVEVAQTHRREEETAAKVALEERMAAQAQKLEDDKARRRLREQVKKGDKAKKGGEKISPQLGTSKQPLAAWVNPTQTLDRGRGGQSVASSSNAKSHGREFSFDDLDARDKQAQHGAAHTDRTVRAADFFDAGNSRAFGAGNSRDGAGKIRDGAGKIRDEGKIKSKSRIVLDVFSDEEDELEGIECMGTIDNPQEIVDSDLGEVEDLVKVVWDVDNAEEEEDEVAFRAGLQAEYQRNLNPMPSPEVWTKQQFVKSQAFRGDIMPEVVRNCHSRVCVLQNEEVQAGHLLMALNTRGDEDVSWEIFEQEPEAAVFCV
jgi:hypothetical protein